MTQENNQQEYVLPQDVDYTKPMKLDICGTIYTYDPETTLTHNTDSGWEDYCNFIVKDIIAGRAKVLKEKEDLFGSTFQFLCTGDDEVFTYHKTETGFPKITWGCDGESSSYSEEYIRELVKNGDWTILPTTPKQPTNTPKQFDEESLKAAEQIVSEALRPTVEAATLHFVNGSVWEFKEPTNWYEFFYDEPADNVLDIIKQACTGSQGRIVVQVNKDGYEVFHHYFYVDSVKVEEDKLKEFLEALCLVDSMDSWSDVC